MPLLTLLAPLALALPAPTDELDDAFENLIERTNALEGFTARYSVTSSDGASGTLTMVYAAPDRLSIACSGEAFPQAVNFWVVGDVICSIASSADCPTMYALAGTGNSTAGALALLDEHFPDPEQSSLGWGPTVVLNLSHSEETDLVTLDMDVAPNGPRTALLGWLLMWQHHSELLELTEDSIVITHERFGGTIALASGFPTEMWGSGKEGETRALRLESLSEGAPSDETAFEFPEGCPSGAEDGSEWMRWNLDDTTNRTNRRLCMRRIEEALVSGRADWTEPVREDIRLVLRALHTPGFRAPGEPLRASTRDWIDSYADWLLRQLDEGYPIEMLWDEVAQRRAELVAKNAGARTAWVESMTGELLPPGGSAHHDDLLDLEAEVVGALHAEIMVQPILAAFDEATDDVLGD